MKTKLATLSLAFLALALFSPPLFAHHGVAEYDMARRITIKGVITCFDWSNPHTQVHIDVSDPKGNVVHWDLENQPPSILTHAGWTRNSLKPGDHVSILISPAKNGSSVGLLSKVTFPNGEELTPTEK
jgi:hypothetical protein